MAAGWVPPGVGFVPEPWQLPQAWAPAFQAMGFAPAPFLKLPWQYVLEQVIPEKAGVTPPVVATAAKATFSTPFAWSGFTGMAPEWHSAQVTCRENVGPPAAPVRRCFACAPTPVPEAWPSASTGGAPANATPFASVPRREASPWQVVQEGVVYCTMPSTWVAATTFVPV